MAASSPLRRLSAPELETVDELCSAVTALRDLRSRLNSAVERGNLERVPVLRKDYDDLCASIIANVERLALLRCEGHSEESGPTRIPGESGRDTPDKFRD